MAMKILTPIVRRVPHAVGLENDACHRGFNVVEHELRRNGREEAQNAHVAIQRRMNAKLLGRRLKNDVPIDLI